MAKVQKETAPAPAALLGGICNAGRNLQFRRSPAALLGGICNVICWAEFAMSFAGRNLQFRPLPLRLSAPVFCPEL